MALAIRLSRSGAKKRPYYRIVVADSRSPRDGRFIEKVGTYNPLLAKDSPDRVKLDQDRVSHWLSVGAQPSDRVLRFLDAAGIRERQARNNPNKGEPGEKAKERTEARAAREAEAALAPEDSREEAEQVIAAEVEAATAEPTPEAEEVVAEIAEQTPPVEEEAVAEIAEQAPPVEEEVAAADAPSEEPLDATNEGKAAEAPAEDAEEGVPSTEEPPTAASAEKAE